MDPYMEPFIVDQRAIGAVVSLDQIREHLNLFDDTSYDTLLAGISAVAHTSIEDYLGEFLGFTSVVQPFSDFAQDLSLIHI